MSYAIPAIYAGVFLLVTSVAKEAAPYLIPGPDSGRTGTAGQSQVAQNAKESDAETFSSAAGHILGAALGCNRIDEGRVDKAASKAMDMATAIAINDDDVAAAQADFIGTAAEGRNAVENGLADCTTVEALLGRLEQVEATGSTDATIPDNDDTRTNNRIGNFL
jgi:hypothetical protein